MDAPGSYFAVRHPQRPDGGTQPSAAHPGGLPDRHCQRCPPGRGGPLERLDAHGAGRAGTDQERRLGGGRHRPLPPLSRRPGAARRHGPHGPEVLGGVGSGRARTGPFRPLGAPPLCRRGRRLPRAGDGTGDHAPPFHPAGLAGGPRGRPRPRSSAPLCPLCGRLRRGVRRGGPLVGDAQRAERPHGPRLCGGAVAAPPPVAGSRPAGRGRDAPDARRGGDGPPSDWCRPRPAGDGLDRPPRTALPASSRLHRRPLRRVAAGPRLQPLVPLELCPRPGAPARRQRPGGTRAPGLPGLPGSQLLRGRAGALRLARLLAPLRELRSGPGAAQEQPWLEHRPRGPAACPGLAERGVPIAGDGHRERGRRRG